MRVTPPTEDVPDDVIWWRFKRQTALSHLLVVAGGFLVWGLVYLYWLDAVVQVLEFGIAESPEAVVARQQAIRSASTACWVWFSVAFMFGKGGPFLNTTIYPVIAVVFGPIATSLAVWGEVPENLYSLTDSAVHPAYIIDGISFFLPGIIVSGVLVGGFLLASTYITGTIEEWAEKHMPDAYHEIEIENPERWEQ